MALLAVAFAAAAAVLIGARVHGAAERKLREAILAELQPVTFRKTVRSSALAAPMMAVI